MTTTLANTFEGGTTGTTLTQGSGGNTGGASGSYFDFVSIGTGATLAFDNAEAAHGALSCKVATGSTSTTAYAEWRGQLTGTTVATLWFRQYLYLTANPSGAFRVWAAYSTNTLCAAIVLQTNGTFVFRDSANVGITGMTMSSTIPLNQFLRIEGFVTGSASVGQVELKLFKTADSTTADETKTSAASQNTNGSINAARFGPSTSSANSGPFWMDDIGASDTAYLGPSGNLPRLPLVVSQAVIAASLNA